MKYCGYTLPAVIMPQSGQVHLIFRSDKYTVEEGFSVDIRPGMFSHILFYLHSLTRAASLNRTTTEQYQISIMTIVLLFNNRAQLKECRFIISY